MSIFASCGHEITTDWMCDQRSSVSYPEIARDGTPAVIHACYCQPCATRLAADLAAGKYGPWPEWYATPAANTEETT